MNDERLICSKCGKFCHGDDIARVFGQYSSPAICLKCDNQNRLLGQIAYFKRCDLTKSLDAVETFNIFEKL